MEEEKQIIPNIFNITSTPPDQTTLSNFTYKKMELLLKEVNCDSAISVPTKKDQGSAKILLRSDIIPYYYNAKNIINSLESILSCEYIDININNNISKIAKLGLQFNMNLVAGITPLSNYRDDDYYIGPDYSKKYGMGYRLKVYGFCKRFPLQNNTNYKIINEVIDVYDIRDTYLYTKPKIKKIYKPVIDITQILEDNGFKQEIPDNDFFIKSNYFKSNWNVFYNINKIKPGDLYKDLLKYIYGENNVESSKYGNLMWNGSKFI